MRENRLLTLLQVGLDTAPVPPKAAQTDRQRAARNKRNVKRSDGDLDADDPMAHFSNSGMFWKNVAEFVAPFTQQDLDFCKTGVVSFLLHAPVPYVSKEWSTRGSRIDENP